MFLGILNKYLLFLQKYAIIILYTTIYSNVNYKKGKCGL